ncbi:Asp23/Gls24 family envelope stress response protein [Liquorilactobacillus vini]|uniref:Stress response regulator gls24 homolog n=1 Tax=Liquorilactobacillus vini DSM 20605 TaxID=1133569 RepID=A0A0R2BYT8_9LACO|nr:Asp23/Gls24 family envelope stress response protein [Liquorilactobacillus vini]KRM84327.1 alkaline shock protein 23 [Liquorilactobacillus vini DSM 20605]
MENKEKVLKTTLTYDDGVIEKIAGLAARNVDGILALNGGMFSEITDRFRAQADPTQGIDAEVGKKQVALEMNATVEYGKDIQQIFQTVTQKVARDIRNFTGLEVIELNLHINDVMSKRQWQEEAKGKPNSQLATDSKQLE